jgi:transcription initiation factor TFIIIB Brf1 subunit/transcription initiation factor TFIIB
MGKCTICGKKGLFVKVNDKGVCKDCEAVAKRKATLDSIEKRLADKEALMRQVQAEALDKIDRQIDDKNKKLTRINTEIINKTEELSNTNDSLQKAIKDWETASKKVAKIKPLYKSFMNQFESEDFYYKVCTNPESARREFASKFSIIEDDALYSPSVILHTHSMDMKDLRKKLKDNRAAIDAVTQKYLAKYTTKANKAIYILMTMALEAELQNIIFSMNGNKLDVSLKSVDNVIQKYLKIASDGNQTIVNTLVHFIGEIETLYKNVVQIEFEYYTIRERVKEEQRALREQMRQEAEERKLLEQQRKKVEEEERKYRNEILNLQEQLQDADEEKQTQINDRINEINSQLEQVESKKEDIINLQNGKAGYVYIISNLGSFGDNVFKIGMTRRLNPQERVDELGSASVPFPFDIHGMIFSDDAVSLENKMHKILTNQRVNKVNFRKEFFAISIDELQNLVQELAPTAEFKTTMLAEQYRQSLSIGNGEMSSLSDEINLDEVASDTEDIDD